MHIDANILTIDDFAPENICSIPTVQNFLGICLDSGAARSVAGKSQWLAFVNSITPSKVSFLQQQITLPRFKFGTNVFPAEKYFLTTINLPSKDQISFLVHIITHDAPFLLELDAL